MQEGPRRDSGGHSLPWQLLGKFCLRRYEFCYDWKIPFNFSFVFTFTLSEIPDSFPPGTLFDRDTIFLGRGVTIYVTKWRQNRQQDFNVSLNCCLRWSWLHLINMWLYCFRYGDKVPQTIYGRIFSILWMLTGVCLIAIFTAAVTSAITVSSVGSNCGNTQGKHVSHRSHSVFAWTVVKWVLSS